ncbi:hypothetical protein ACIQ6K_28950 [Streptomyces sp. NPDC096354]|uniref:hypothetical protein n=1 Tax=Streptomyces sp. NPDC096354 TaxID=3366088 RepID=UPI00382BDEFA
MSVAIACVDAAEDERPVEPPAELLDEQLTHRVSAALRLRNWARRRQLDHDRG